MITELRNDMKAECEKFGEVRKVIVFDVSIDSFSCTFFYVQETKWNVLRHLISPSPQFAEYQLFIAPQELHKF